MSRFARFVSSVRTFLRLVKVFQTCVLELVLVAIFFVGLYKFAVVHSQVNHSDLGAGMKGGCPTLSSESLSALAAPSC